MILDFILSVVAWLLKGLGNLLPTIDILPNNLATDLASFMSYINGWSWLFPVSTLISILGILVLLVLVEFLYFTTMYVLSIIHASIRG